MRIALVHDHFQSAGGAERVLEVLHGIFPEAPIYGATLSRDKLWPGLHGADLRPSWMQRLPAIRTKYRSYLPFYPLAIEGLDLLLNASYIDAEVQDVPFRLNYAGQTSQPIVDDVEPVYTPEWQMAGIARYEFPLFGGFGRVQGDFNYSDEFYYNLRNFDGDKFDDYTIWNAHVGWTTEDGQWDFALEFRNITDENAGIQGFDLATLCGCNEESWRAPRWWGLRAKYAFGE